MIRRLLLVAVIGLSVGPSITMVEGFQWMSKFKMPTYDPNAELIEEKFGNRSE